MAKRKVIAHEDAHAGPPRLHDRRSGVLLHPTSLPGPYGNGDIGPEAHRFAAQLAAARQSWWQMLPVGPLGYGNSPYSAQSAFAGNPLLISLDLLADEGLIDRGVPPTDLATARVDFARAAQFRDERLRAAFQAFRGRGGESERALSHFRRRQRAWLDDWALYRALKQTHDEVAWTQWEPELRDRKRSALERARRELADEIAYQQFLQLTFARQWSALRERCASLGVGLIGDVPIFVAHDSADVWQNAELFRLDAQGQPKVVAGVPPDYFSKTGQLWGNPLYRWGRIQKDDFGFWVARIELTLQRFDAIRLDHFIGFHRYWEIPAGAATAETGRYVKGPGARIFKALRAAHGELPLIAEDLGVVTPEVKALRDRFDLPGIRVLQFAFGEDPCAPDFLPHNYPRRCVAYTGTHDNDTTVGWFSDRGGDASTRSEAQAEIERRATMSYLASDGRDIHWDMIRMVQMSVADLAIVPAQDLIGLGTEGRMNLPGTASGNWEWRLLVGQLGDDVLGRLATLTDTYGRSPPEASTPAGKL